MTPPTPCDALVQPDDWSQARACQNSGTAERQGHPVCGTHARQYDRWTEQRRDWRMAAHWWKWSAP